MSDIADAATADYNDDTNIDDLIDNTFKKIIMRKLRQQKIVKKHRNLARKKTYQRPAKKTGNGDDVVFLKQEPIHPRDRLARKTKDDVKFVKKVPLHPRERLKGKRKSTTIDNYIHLSKKSKNEDVTLIKQVPLHWRERMKRLAKINDKVHFIKEVSSTKPKNLVKAKRNIDKMKNINDQIRAANENTKNLMLGKFNFDPKEILNKKLIFDTTIIDEEIIIDRIIDAINDSFNDRHRIKHIPGRNYFTLRLEDGR